MEADYSPMRGLSKLLQARNVYVLIDNIEEPETS